LKTLEAGWDVPAELKLILPPYEWSYQHRTWCESAFSKRWQHRQNVCVVNRTGWHNSESDCVGLIRGRLIWLLVRVPKNGVRWSELCGLCLVKFTFLSSFEMGWICETNKNRVLMYWCIYFYFSYWTILLCSKMATDKIKVAVRVRPFNRRGRSWDSTWITAHTLFSYPRFVTKKSACMKFSVMRPYYFPILSLVYSILKVCPLYRPKYMHLVVIFICKED
jgi:hypothetical protein